MVMAIAERLDRAIDVDQPIERVAEAGARGDERVGAKHGRGDHRFGRDEPAYVPHPHKARVIHADYPRPRAKPATKEAAKSHNRPAKKAYGASERQGLDRLIQSTSGGGKKP